MDIHEIPLKTRRTAKWWFEQCYNGFLAQFNTTVDATLLSGDSATFWTDSAIEMQRARHLMGERRTVSSFVDEIEPDDIVYDIGANVGTYSCFAIKSLVTGMLVAFEPNDRNYERLKENLSLNANENWAALKYALSDKDGTTTFDVGGSTVGVGTHSLSENGAATVEQRRIETLIEQDEIPPPSVVKMDIEGAELLALRGFSNYLEDVRVLYCEVHPTAVRSFGNDPDEIGELLNRYGLEIVERHQRGGEQHIIAKRSH